MARCDLFLNYRARYTYTINAMINDHKSTVSFPSKYRSMFLGGNSFLFKVFGGHMSFFWGHWYPCFGFLVTSPLGFKARVGSALFTIFAEANVMYIPQDSPLVLTLADLLVARRAAGHFSTCMCRGGRNSSGIADTASDP